jgi:hypothetical protein
MGLKNNFTTEVTEGTERSGVLIPDEINSTPSLAVSGCPLSVNKKTQKRNDAKKEYPGINQASLDLVQGISVVVVSLCSL